MSAYKVPSSIFDFFVQLAYDTEVDALAELLKRTKMGPLEFATRKLEINNKFEHWEKQLAVSIKYRDIVKQRPGWKI